MDSLERPCDMKRPSGSWALVAALMVSLLPAPTAGQELDTTALPVVAIDRPTVIIFYLDPDSVSDPDAKMGLYSALDQQQTHMADTRSALNELGMYDVTQPGRRFILRDGTRDTRFEASPDSSVVGYVLVAPGREHRVVYRVQFYDSLLAEVREYLGIGSGARS